MSSIAPRVLGLFSPGYGSRVVSKWEWLPVALLAGRYLGDPLTRGAAAGLAKSELAQAIGRKQKSESGGGSHYNYYVYLPIPITLAGQVVGLPLPVN